MIFLAHEGQHKEKEKEEEKNPLHLFYYAEETKRRLKEDFSKWPVISQKVWGFGEPSF